MCPIPCVFLTCAVDIPSSGQAKEHYATSETKSKEATEELPGSPSLRPCAFRIGLPNLASLNIQDIHLNLNFGKTKSNFLVQVYPKYYKGHMLKSY